jgi:peptidoglycan hydrolase CwlO-like protein
MEDNATMKKRVRAITTGLLFLILSLSLSVNYHATAGERSDLQEESNRLTYELLQLRTRRDTAENQGDSLRQELAALDARIRDTQSTIDTIKDDIKAFQDSYDASMRTLYKMGGLTELEILLESQQLDEAWQDHTIYERLMAQDGEKMQQLGDKMDEVKARERELKEDRDKRARVAETLDIAGLDAQIGQLEARLSQVNDALREQNISGGNPPSPKGKQDGGPPAVPAAGGLLDRVTEQPSLADFKRSGITMGGFTTCYGEEFDGRPTASGVTFHMYDYTCAHKTLPFGTWLLVSFKGRQVIVQVNDRGPFVPGRVLDLSFGAARSIGLDGVQWTDFEILVPKGG